jgi:predicted ArsR family transcriptional regulator
VLDRLLVLLRSGETRRVADLARALDTSPALIETMLDDLCRRGYLRRVGDSCEDKCAACPASGLCAAGSSGQLWALTEKGLGS